MATWNIGETVDTPAGVTPAVTLDDRIALLEAKAVRLQADLRQQRRALAVLVREYRALSAGARAGPQEGVSEG